MIRLDAGCDWCARSAYGTRAELPEALRGWTAWLLGNDGHLVDPTDPTGPLVVNPDWAMPRQMDAYDWFTSPVETGEFATFLLCPDCQGHVDMGQDQQFRAIDAAGRRRREAFRVRKPWEAVRPFLTVLKNTGEAENE